MIRPRLLLVNDAALLGHHGSALVTARLRALMAEAGLDLATGWGWERIEAVDFAASGFRGALVNGEGSLHDDSAAARRLARLLPRMVAAGLPVWLVNASVSGLSDEIAAPLRLARGVWARDRASLGWLAARGVPARHVPDLTLSWSGAPRWRGDGTALFVTDASDDGAARRILAAAKRTPGAEFVSLRARPPEAADGAPNRRLRAWRWKHPIARLLPLSAWSARYRGRWPTVEDAAADLAARSGGVISARYHGVCLALRIGIPFLALAANTSKTADLLADAGLGARMLATEGSPPAPLPAPPPFSAEELARIAAFLQTAEQGAREMVVEIAAALERGAPAD